MTPADHRYVVLVPVKPAERAKTRLHGHPRAALARAFALDAVGAALSARWVAAVHLVSDDADLVRAAAGLGAGAVPDLGAGDLNAALSRAAGLLRERGERGPVAAMLGDLPCLVPADLDAALEEADDLGGGFVPDSDGTGTTLLAARHTLAPRFGPGSRDAHATAGVPEVGLSAETLRRDVDTAADLESARALGLGAHTAAALGASG